MPVSASFRRGLGLERDPVLKKSHIVFLCAAVAFVAKQVLSWFTFGSNDMIIWGDLIEGLQQYGTFDIYRHVLYSNHPPLILWLLQAAWFLHERTGIPFPFLWRFVPILADAASVFVIWRLMGLHGARHRTAVCVLCALSPINFLLAGFHGNTDPVLAFLVLVCIYLFETERYEWMGAVYGLSLCVKVVPLLVFPVFLYFVAQRRKVLQFLLPAAICPLVVFTPYVLHDAPSMIRNVLAYRSIGKVWGLSRIAHWVNGRDGLPVEWRNAAFDFYFWHRSQAGLPFYALLLCMMLAFKPLRVSLLEAVFAAFGLFLAVTPGFGIQYLCWISLLAILVFPAAGALFNAAGGYFLARVYIYWGALAPPHVADKETAEYWWHGSDDLLCFLLWLTLVAMLVALARRKAKLARAVPAG